MSKIDAIEIVVTPMKTIFAAPQTVSRGAEDAALNEYADALQRFDRPDLVEGWREVRDSHQRAWWPSPGLLVKACSDARKNRLDSMPGVPEIKGRMVGGRIEMWGGGCMCPRCRADKEHHRREQQPWRDWVRHLGTSKPTRPRPQT